MSPLSITGSGGGGRVLSYRHWGPGFDTQRRLIFFHNIWVFTQIFCFSFRDTHLGQWLFYLSVFPVQLVKSSAILHSLFFLCVQVVQDKQMLLLYICSLSTWHFLNQASIRHCCFLVQWDRQNPPKNQLIIKYDFTCGNYHRPFNAVNPS